MSNDEPRMTNVADPPSRDEPAAAPPFDQWALVEVMGHRRLAGRVIEERIAGVAMLRVDVPGSPEAPAFTTYLGATSIFSLTPVSEQLARAKAAEWQIRPVSVFKTDLQHTIGYRDDVDDIDFDE